MGQDAQIVMEQIVHHYFLTMGGPGPPLSMRKLHKKEGIFISPLFGFRNAHAEISDRHP